MEKERKGRGISRQWNDVKNSEEKIDNENKGGVKEENDKARKKDKKKRPGRKGSTMRQEE